MLSSANIWHTCFYILCKGAVVFYFLFCMKEVILGLIDIIRMSMVQQGPCKALKELESRLTAIEKEG